MSEKDAARRAKKKKQKDKLRAARAAQLRREREGNVRRIWQAPGRDDIVWDPGREGIDGLARNSRLLGYQAAKVIERLARRSSRGAEALWTPRKVGALETEDITRRLEALGIATSPDDLRGMLEGAWETWRVTERAWLPRLDPAATVHDRDFARLAACELRARWMPDPPFQEQVLALYADLRLAHEEHDHVGEIRYGIAFWERIEAALSEGMDASEIAERLHCPMSIFMVWADAFAHSALLVGRADAALAGEAAATLAAAAERLAGEPDDDWRASLLADAGALLFLAGRSEEGEQTLRDVIASHPDESLGYARLADAWSDPEDAPPEALARALALLEEATARPVLDGGDWDLEERIEELRERLDMPDLKRGEAWRRRP